MHSTEAIQLQRLISSAIMMGRNHGKGSGGSITIRKDAGLSAISVIVTPFSSGGAFAHRRSCALVFLCDQARKRAPRPAVLRDLFRLTPSECRLADLLHSALELRNAGETLGVTMATARFMLKRIFSKTGTHRQSELVLLLSRLPAPFASHPQK